MKAPLQEAQQRTTTRLRESRLMTWRRSPLDTHPPKHRILVVESVASPRIAAPVRSSALCCPPASRFRLCVHSRAPPQRQASCRHIRAQYLLLGPPSFPESCDPPLSTR